MKTILYFHQSAELYGSDKTLLQLVIGMSLAGHKVIVVVPNEGLLTQEFKKNNIRYIVSPVLKLHRDMFTFRKMFLSFLDIFSSIKKIRKETKNLKIDFIHSNTLAVLNGAIYAKLFHIQHIWHIHEIIEKPKIVKKIFKFLINSFSDIVVFNSNATAIHWGIKNDKISYNIIYNGSNNFEISLSADEINVLRKKFLDTERQSIIITLVGRISRFKGQQLLLKAFELACKDKTDCHLVFVGNSPSGQEHYQNDLEKMVNGSQKKDFIHILPYQKNIDEVYTISDIIVVPSTEPESFGMVALEAMAAERAVIVAGHGGILEIIDHNKTGIIFEPSNLEDLARSLNELIENKQLRERLGKAAREKAKEFSLGKYLDSFEKLYSTEK